MYVFQPLVQVRQWQKADLQRALKQANTSIQTLFQASVHPVAADVLLIIDLRM